MKYILLLITFMIFFSGCQENRQQNSMKLLHQQNRYNPNNIVMQNVEKQKDRQTQLQIAKIEANAKLEAEKIKSQNQFQIAKINAETHNKIAQIDSKTKIETTKIEAITEKENMKYIVYISIAFIVLFAIALILFYLSGKKKRDLEQKMLQERLKHEQFLKERELEEQRVHKLLELMGEGKLPEHIEQDVILTLSKPKNNLIDHKE